MYMSLYLFMYNECIYVSLLTERHFCLLYYEINSCIVYIYWIFLVSVYSVTLCLYMYVVCCITMYKY